MFGRGQLPCYYALDIVSDLQPAREMGSNLLQPVVAGVELGPCTSLVSDIAHVRLGGHLNLIPLKASIRHHNMGYHGCEAVSLARVIIGPVEWGRLSGAFLRANASMDAVESSRLHIYKCVRGEGVSWRLVVGDFRRIR